MDSQDNTHSYTSIMHLTGKVCFGADTQLLQVRQEIVCYLNSAYSGDMKSSKERGGFVCTDSEAFIIEPDLCTLLY